MNKVFLISFLFASMLVFNSINNVSGLSCIDTSMQKNFENSDVVFLGKVISKEYVKPEFDYPNPDWKDSKTTFSVIESFKGIKNQTVTIKNSEWFFGMNFTIGLEYVVFADYEKVNNLRQKLCAPTKPVEYMDLDAIRKITYMDILPPLKQLKEGIDINEITCRGELELIVKSINDFPACVKPKSISKLIERGWVKLEINDIDKSSFFDCAKRWDDMMAFTSNYSNTGLNSDQIDELDNTAKELGDSFFKNKCVSKIDDWWQGIEDLDGYNMGMNFLDMREIWLREELRRNMGIP